MGMITIEVVQIKRGEEPEVEISVGDSTKAGAVMAASVNLSTDVEFATNLVMEPAYVEK